MRHFALRGRHAILRQPTKDEANIMATLGHNRKMLGAEKYAAGRFKDASHIFEDMSTRRECPEFLTLEAYEYL